MLCNKTRDELMNLLDALINETISPEQHQRLEALLMAEPEARELFRQYIHFHCQLKQLAQSWAQQRLLRLTEAIEFPPPPPSGLSTTEPSRPGLIYGLVLSLLVGFAAGVLWLRHLAVDKDLAPPVAPSAGAASVQEGSAPQR